MGFWADKHTIQRFYRLNIQEKLHILDFGWSKVWFHTKFEKPYINNTYFDHETCTLIYSSVCKHSYFATCRKFYLLCILSTMGFTSVFAQLGMSIYSREDFREICVHIIIRLYTYLFVMHTCSWCIFVFVNCNEYLFNNKICPAVVTLHLYVGALHGLFNILRAIWSQGHEYCA